eukprot:gene19353-23170_t
MSATRNIVVERIEKFISETYFTDVNIRGKIYPQKDATAVTLQVSPQCDRIEYKDALNLSYEPCQVGRSFGPSWATYWFKVHVAVPASMKGKEVHLLWNSSSEALIWRDGVPVQGLTGGTWDDRRVEYKLTDCSNGTETYDLYIEMACNAEVGLFDRTCYELYTYFTMLYDMAKNFKEDDRRGNQALFTANSMINHCDIDDRSTWTTCISMAKKFFAQTNGASQHNVSAIGHCHIDVAWLWPYAETKRKCARSFATQVLYMEYYPEYKFVQSQAQLYAWTKQLYPDLYAKMKDRVATGQLVPTGGTWVEMDGNLPSGESFIRQFLVGQTFFKKEFGKYSTEFWLPDTFGYSGQLPQVIRHMGIEHFITQKLSWNNINKFPHSTFHWEGIDGSRVLTHFPPANTYNSAADVKEVALSASNNKNADRSGESLLVYGHGDGGGGPNIGMIERLTRMPDCDGIPKVALRSPAEFFERVIPDQDKLFTWIGELYFELHRGTYTTQAKCKKGNRKGEFLLHDIEALSSLLEMQLVADFTYPDLQNLWELLLLNQFHDVLPGSSIGMVYDDAAAHHLQIETEVRNLIQAAMVTVGGNSRDVLVFNPTSFNLTRVVELSPSFKSAQKAHNGSSLVTVTVPALGFARVSSVDDHPQTAKITVTESDQSFVVENDFIILTIGRNGSITSLVEKTSGREMIVPGKSGNQFVLYDDIPLFWDAWDVEVYSQEKFKICGGAASATLLERGPTRVVITLDYPTLTPHAKLSQRVVICANSARVDFETTVDWHEAHKFLRVEFPTTLTRAQNATYDIQFGNVQRPTHLNTSWDVAKFEVCGHKWADVSEYDAGVALLNDCKYGYSVRAGLMKLSLLRAPKAPDANADMGQHTFTYSLYPHAGSFQAGGVVREGYDVNSEFYIVNAPAESAPNVLAMAPLKLEGSASVVLETLKKAEDGNGHIVRVYESFGGHASFTFANTPASVIKLVECNGLEEPIGEHYALVDSQPSINLTPFQVKTFRLM